MDLWQRAGADFPDHHAGPAERHAVVFASVARRRCVETRRIRAHAQRIAGPQIAARYAVAGDRQAVRAGTRFSAWFLAGVCCADARAEYPMNYLRTYGPAADAATRLNWGLIAISLAVTAIIGVLVLWAAFRRRPPLTVDANGRLPVEPARGGLRWIYIGVGISSVVLLASTIWTVQTLAAIAVPPQEANVNIKITAHQWWWEVEYTGASPAETFITANEVHIPVGEPVRFKLASNDVIHSFWIPQLAGKTD